MTRKFQLAAAAAAMAVLGGAPAAGQAVSADFLACDGYGAPTKGGDAMTRGIVGIHLLTNARTSNELRRQVPPLGADAIERCTAALASPRLEPGHAIRRASLLHGRALHRLASSDTVGALRQLAGNETAAALEDLRQAEQAAAGAGRLIERSFGLSLRLTRAYALLKSGNAAEAAAISSAVMADRPFEPGITYAAARIHFAATHDWSAYVQRMRSLAAVDPNLISALFALASARGEYAEAVALHPQIVMSVPRARGGYRIEGIHDVAAEQVAMRAWLDGAYAYALQARGEAAAADAALAAAATDLAAALAEPVARDGGRPGRQRRLRHRAIAGRGQEAMGALGSWERHVRLQRLVAEGRLEDVAAELDRAPVEPGPAALDLFEQMARARPEMRDQLGPLLGPLRERIYAEINRAMTFTAKDLADRLPEPESPARLPVYEPAGGSFRMPPSDGYRTRRGPVAGVQTVRFSSPRGSIATANELALLRAAQAARENGHRGLIVIARRGVIRTINTTGVGGRALARPSGQEVEIDVLFVDPENLPPDFADARWRVLDPDAIWTALRPVYAAPDPPPAAR